MSWARVIPLMLALSVFLGGCKKKPSAAPTESTNKGVMTQPAAPTMAAQSRPAMGQPPRTPPRPRLAPVPPVVKLDETATSLVKVVEAALRANKPAAVLALLPAEANFKGCPALVEGAVKQWGSFEKAVANTAKQVKDAFRQCQALGSWAKAKRVQTHRHKGEPKPLEGCQRLLEHGHIYVTYAIGKKTATVRISSPTRVDGKEWILLDGIRCRVAGDPWR